MNTAPPTPTDVRVALREYYEAKAAVEASEPGQRLLRAERRLQELKSSSPLGGGDALAGSVAGALLRRTVYWLGGFSAVTEADRLTSFLRTMSISPLSLAAFSLISCICASRSSGSLSTPRIFPHASQQYATALNLPLKFPGYWPVSVGRPPIQSLLRICIAWAQDYRLFLFLTTHHTTKNPKDNHDR